jgi:hypothetical protein
MTPDDIKSAVAALQAKAVEEEERAWGVLRPLGAAVVPYLLAAYPTFKSWQGRVSLVYHSTRYARVSEDAFRLGIAALGDRSRVVRYRACGVLAYSLRTDALEPLRALRVDAKRAPADDANAAINAIEAKNHHFFVDRHRTGRSFWVVNEDADRL